MMLIIFKEGLNRMYHLLFVCCLLWGANGYAQGQAESIWTPSTEDRIESIGERDIKPSQFSVWSLDVEALQEALSDAPRRYSKTAQTKDVLVEFPLPEEGRVATFRVMEVATMEETLQEKFPAFKTYLGVNIENPLQRIRFDWTSQGFHAMVLKGGGNGLKKGSFFIHPFQTGDIENYICYYKKDNDSACGFECKTQSDLNTKAISEEVVMKSMTGDCELRTYRLAVAATGEYTNYHGGSTNALAAIVTAINQVNEVYEIDLSISLLLVGNNDLVVYSDPFTDPFTNPNPYWMLSENQSNMSSTIGGSNYDIGHVFATSSTTAGFGVGVAGVGVICNTNAKAYGVSGSPTPVGAGFAVDYVAHEMGHQLGANHTFNSSCGGNVWEDAAVEPGSGSTILGYAGICSPSVQDATDPYFHGLSLEEIVSFTNTGSGDNCAQLVSTSNTGPIVNAGSDYTIPVSTPFELTAIASDAEGDILTYCWEQMDNEIVTQPPLPSNSGGPSFRSFSPTTLPNRTFPALYNILNGTNDPWEVLPSISRMMNFRVTVRDNNPEGGCTDFDDMTVVTAATAGPFLVTSPDTPVNWSVGDTETVTWDVAGTDVAPVSCAFVDIVLSTDGGITFPYVLASGVANSGSELITVPNYPSSSCRVKVICADNIFFDVSSENFSIQANQATFTLSASGNNSEVCGTGSLNYLINLESLFGFNSAVSLTASGGPAGTIFSFGASTLIPNDSTDLLISIPSGNAVGTYQVQVTASDGNITKTEQINIIVNASPGQTSLAVPLNEATEVSINPTLAWAMSSLVTGYTVEIASDSLFNNIVEMGTTAGSSWTVESPLNTFSTYYWRVYCSNACGLAPSSNVFSFETEGPTYCIVGSSNIQSEWIESVAFASINNVSNSDSGYGDYTGISTDLDIGVTYMATLTPGYSVGDVWPEYWRIWIDFDRNGDFDGANEMVFDAGGTDTVAITAFFTVPQGVSLGSTRMRISMEWVDPTDDDSNGPPEPCEFLGWGEVEDYTVNIVSDCMDVDSDSVCDEDDLCIGGDDLVDTNNNNIPDDCDLTEVNLKVMLEGPFDELTGTMATALLDNNILPIVQSYTSTPYYYSGIEVAVPTPSEMVDWVLVEVRSGPNPSDLFDRKAGVLLSDGSIKGADGVNGLMFDLPAVGEFYFVIRHRNHLDIMTNISFPRSLIINYDFTTGVGQAYGNQQQTALPNGMSAMYGGDVNRDLVIQTTDYDAWKAEPAIFGTYEDTDINLDGQVQVTDYDIWFLNKAKVSVPELGY